MDNRLFGITYFPRLYETTGEYFELSIEELTGLLTKNYEVKYKDNAPGFIGGKLENNSREIGNQVLYRSCLSIDFDHITDLDTWFDAIQTILKDYYYIMYTSFSHSDLEGKIRVIIPLLKDIPAGLYSDFITNIFSYSLNRLVADSIDKTCHEPKRFMFLHSSPLGKNKGFTYVNKVEKYLDISWYPYGEHLSEKKESEYKEIESLYPTYKEAIETFNNKYPNEKAFGVIKDEEYIDFFNSIDIMWFVQNKLSKIYTNQYKNRFKYYKSASNVCGAVIYNNTLFSNHDSDPAGNGFSHGCFNLLKIHLCDGSYISALNHIKRILNPRLY